MWVIRNILKSMFVDFKRSCVLWWREIMITVLQTAKSRERRLVDVTHGAPSHDDHVLDGHARTFVFQN